MKNERLLSIFASYPYETRVMVSMMEALLGNDKVEKVLDGLDKVGLPQDIFIEGRPLRFYSGLSDEQLEAIGLSAEGKSQLYEYYEKPPKSKTESSVDPKPETPAKTEESKTESSSSKQIEEDK